MLAVDEVLAEALRSHQAGGISAVARYRGREVPLLVDPSGSVKYSASADVEASTQITIFGFGDSLVPRRDTDMLATCGQEIALWRTVRVSAQEWELPLGVFRIARAGDAVEHRRGDTVLDWSVNLTLQDRFKQIRQDDFLAVETPALSSTVWAEMQRLSPIPVQEALGDAPVPPGTVYESRIDAIRALLSIIGGVPHLTREGVLTARLADGWTTVTSPVFDIAGVISWSDEMTDDFFNQVQVTNPNSPDIVAYARLEEAWNPRSVQNAGGRTYKHAATIYEAQGAALAAARTILRRVSSRRAQQIKVTCTPEALLLELGDVGWFRDHVGRRAVLGEVASIDAPLDPTAAVTVEVIAAQVIGLDDQED